jgi:dipeptidase E
MDLLLLSNSTNFGEEYLSYPRQAIKDFLGDIKNNIVFIPYAGVTFSWDEYTNKVNDALAEIGIRVSGIHSSSDPLKSIDKAEAILMGGGNSFNLLSKLYKNDLVKAIQEKVFSGTPYIGWSAGSNMACPTLKTTNDMPIVEPPSFKALNLIPFQINPHYTEAVIPNHGGESRELRIMEFIEANKEMMVIGLPEGMIIQLKNGHYDLIGYKQVKIFKHGMEPYFIQSSEELNKVLSKS